MTNFEKLTETPEALDEFLASLPVADGPWDAEFHKVFCADCGRENCDGKRCPHKAERNNPMWWLTQAAEGERVTRRFDWIWRNGRLDALIAHKAGGGAELMDGAPLYLALGIDRADVLHEPLVSLSY